MTKPAILDALQRAETFMEGFEDDDQQKNIADDLRAIRNAILHLHVQVQDMAALADSIEKLDVDYNISEFYGLSDWAAFAAGVAKGRRAAAELVRAKGSAKQDERGHNLSQLEIYLQKLIAADLHKARMASNNEDLRMWFVSELISEASGQIPLLEIEGLVSRQLAAVQGGDA